jgi:PAS domain S-box-containing protein
MKWNLHGKMDNNNEALKQAGTLPRKGVTLRVKMLLSFGMVLVLSMVLTNWVMLFGVPYTSFYGSFQEKRINELRRLSLIADLKKKDLITWMDEHEKHISLLAANNQLAAAVSELGKRIPAEKDVPRSEINLRAELSKGKVAQTARQALIPFIRNFPQRKKARIADAKTGIILGSTDEKDPGLSAWESPWFRNALSSNSGRSIDVEKDPDHENRANLVISETIKSPHAQNGHRETLAVVSVHIDLHEIERTFKYKGMGLGKTGEIVLVDQSGRIVIPLKFPPSGQGPAAVLDFKINARPAVQAIQGKEGLIRANDYRGEPVLAAFRHLKITPEASWGMVVKRDCRDIFDPLWRDSAVSALISLVILFLGVAVVWLLANSLTGQMRDLSAAVRRAGEGNLAVRARIKTMDDVGVLAQTFNMMIERIQNWGDELEKQVGDRTAALEKEVAERKQVEVALRESEQDFRSTFEQAAVGVAHVASDGRWLRVNRKLCDIVGYSREELLKRTFQDITYPDDIETDLAHVEQMLAGTIDTYSMEKRYIHKDGVILWINLTVSLIQKSSGEPKYFISVMEDISERKQIELRLLESEEKYRVLAEESPVSIMAFDREGKVTFVNNWHLKTFAKSKYGPDFFVGKKITELPGLVRAGIAPELERILKGETVSFEDVYFPEFTGGHSGYQSIKGVPLFKGDAFVGGILLREDVSQRRQAEDELKNHRDRLEELVMERTKDLEDTQKAILNLLEDANFSKQDLASANKQLQELDRLKSMFIASMSHELRTPLNSIIGFTGIILEGMTGEINDEQRDQLQRVYGSAKHLLALISDVIDISKVEAGKFDVHVEKFQLNEVISEAVSNLTPEITKNGLDLEVSLLQDMQMTSDRKRLLQCVLNFLSNAVKFTQKGGIRISVHEVEEMVEISVEDTGIGIKEADVPMLFGSFVRLDSPIKTTTLGTGLGLYLTKKIATEMLKGSVFVESRYGEGSRFGLRVPTEMPEIKENKS